MILSELTSNLTERRRASLADIANRFDTEADVLRGMLATLERKGRVRTLAVRACGGGCSKCEPTSLDLYEHIEA